MTGIRYYELTHKQINQIFIDIIIQEKRTFY